MKINNNILSVKSLDNSVFKPETLASFYKTAFGATDEMDPLKYHYLEYIIHSLAREKFQIFGYIPDHEKLNKEFVQDGKLCNK